MYDIYKNLKEKSIASVTLDETSSKVMLKRKIFDENTGEEKGEREQEIDKSSIISDIQAKEDNIIALQSQILSLEELISDYDTIEATIPKEEIIEEQPEEIIEES